EAGIGQSGFAGAAALATAAQLNFPTDVALGPAGDLFITDSFNNRIRQLSGAGIITSVAGAGVPGFNWTPRRDFPYFTPEALTADRSGNLYVADDFQRRVVRIGADGVIRAVAGIVPSGTIGIR